MKLGAKRYWTGRPCLRGHISERIIVGNCVECLRLVTSQESHKIRQRLKTAQWAKDNPERADRSLWKKANKDRMAQYRRAWNQRNPEKVKALSKEQARRTKRLRPEVHRAAEALRRARKRMASPQWVDLKAIARVYAACPVGLTVDHILPLAGVTVCGLHVAWNLQYLTPEANSRKKNRLVNLEAYC